MSAPCVFTIYEYDLDAQIKKYAATSAKISTIAIIMNKGGKTVVE
jgi:hypothetical protein